MYWVEVDGVRLPRRVAGHVALDAVNTLAGWDDGRRREWLTGYDLLARWSAYAGLVGAGDDERLRRSAGRRRGDAETALAAFRDLRRWVHRAAVAPDDERALARVSAHVREAAPHAVLATGDGAPAWELRRSAGLDRPRYAAALAAADLLTRVPLERVRACPGAGCGWLFLDVTGRRRWCSMADCGNRAKVAAYARRHR